MTYVLLQAKAQDGRRLTALVLDAEYYGAVVQDFFAPDATDHVVVGNVEISGDSIVTEALHESYNCD